MKLVNFILFLIVTSHAFSQECNFKSFCEKDSLDHWVCGYKDDSGRIVIKQQFKQADPFSFGFAAVYIGEKFGIINCQGNIVIPAVYEWTKPVSDLRFLCLNDNKKLGIINLKNEIVVPFIYDKVYDYYAGKNYLVACKGTKKGMIDVNGKQVFDFIYEQINYLTNGYYAVLKNEKWDIVTCSGKKIINKSYSSVGFYSEGLILVEKNGKFGYIDTLGKELMCFQFDDAHYFQDGFALVEKHYKKYFLSKTGSLDKLPPYLEKIPDSINFFKTDFSEGISYKYHCKYKYNATITTHDNGIEYFDCHYSYSDETGKVLFTLPDTLHTDEYENFRFIEGLAAVYWFNKKNLTRYYGFIDKTGKLVIPCKFGHVDSFSEGLSFIKDYETIIQGNSYTWELKSCGYINKKGQVVIPVSEKFKSPGFSGSPFKDGKAELTIETWQLPDYIIDKTGKVLTTIKK